MIYVVIGFLVGLVGYYFIKKYENKVGGFWNAYLVYIAMVLLVWLVVSRLI